MKNFRVVVNGNEYDVQIEEIKENGEVVAAPVVKRAEPVVKAAAPKAAPAPKKASAGSGSNVVNAPLPGAILEIKVNVGDKVKKGDTLLILEAMKMENEIMAPGDGTVAEVKVQKGNSVNAGDVLIVLS